MWRCPKCQASIRIFDVRTTVTTYADGAEAGDLEWGDENQAECLACDWQGAAGEAARRVDVGSVHVENMFRLVRDVDQLGDRGLHAESHFVLGDPGLGLGVGEPAELLLVEPAECVEGPAARRGVDPRRVRQVQHRVAVLSQRHALVPAGQEAVTEQASRLLQDLDGRPHERSGQSTRAPHRRQRGQAM